MTNLVRVRAILQSPRILLRAPKPADKQDRLSFGRDPEFRKMVGGDWRTCPPLSVGEVDRWYDEVEDDPLRWMIELDGRCVGGARLHSLDEENRRARYAIGLFSPEHRGRGVGTEATRMVLCYAFDMLKLHRVDLRVLEFNERAIACYEQCGFVREGIEREGAFIAEEWHSDVLMSILEQEYHLVSQSWTKPTLDC